MGFLAIYLWIWSKPNIPKEYNLIYWLVGGILITALGAFLLLTKRIADWSIAKTVSFIWLVALGVVCICSSILHLRVI